MEQLEQLTSFEEASRAIQPAEWPPLTEAYWQRTAPDCHWQLIDGDYVRARCSVWWRATPAYGGEQVGLLGHYAASDDHAAQLVLDAAICQLTEHGCTLAIGPLDGSTWERYRFVTECSDVPPFFLEPNQPLCWPEQFRTQGFRPLARYNSTLITDLARRDPHVANRWKALSSMGVTIRSLDRSDPIADLRAIYQLSLTSFHDNFLQTPISEAAFLEQYSAIISDLVSEFTLLAEHEGRLVGYAFGLPDYLQRERGETIDTLILKTVAISPEARYAGLGVVLAETVQQKAAKHGFRRSIHALMYQSNNSRLAGKRYGAVPIREYSLFARRLI